MDEVKLVKKDSKKKRLKPKKIRIFLVIFICLLLFGSGTFYLLYRFKTIQNNKLAEEEKPVELIDYHDYFFEKAHTLKAKKLYKIKDDKMVEIGDIVEDQILLLEQDSYFEKGYFLIKNTTYYVDYKDMEENTKEDEVKATYMNYIPYNESIKTDSETNFYDKDKKKIITILEGVELPIIVKDKDYYGVIFKDELYYVKKDEVKVINKNNTSKKHTNAIATLVYHFVYDVNDKEEGDKCRSWNVTVCLSSTQFKEHMMYLKDNGFYTATMEDLSLFIDGKVQLPEKTVVITIDDGAFVKASTKILEELNLHATLFLIGTFGKPEKYESPSLEIHSHSYNLHTTGKCSGGQGSPLKCLPSEEIQADLKKSRDSLNGSTVFCYPFFEYNDYAIQELKKAGFEMAFIGGRRKITVGSDKYTLPRYGVINTTYVSDIARIVNN